MLRKELEIVRFLLSCTFYSNESFLLIIFTPPTTPRGSNHEWHISNLCFYIEKLFLHPPTDILDIKHFWPCLAQHLCAAARGKWITSCDIYHSRPMNDTFGCSLKTFLFSFAFQYQKQGKDVEKVKQRLAEIANYVDKVKFNYN